MNEMKKEYAYFSSLAQQIHAFIAEKRGFGYKYNTEAKKLREFDQFMLSIGYTEDSLSKELVDAYVAPRDGEAVKTQLHRISIMQQFGRYLARNEVSAFIPPSAYAKKNKPSYIPYIYSNQELTSFFEAADKVEPAYQSPYRYLTVPLLFRILYGCGLRVNEALRLRCCDVDCGNGIFVIKDAKFGRDRLVPMVHSLAERCKRYMQQVHPSAKGQAYFFPGHNGGRYHERSVYSIFRDLLIQSHISHGGRGKGPRVHDFRHTFAVHSLKKWVLSGQDVYVLLPSLSAYMGHTNLSSTAQYLRLTSEVFPDITNRLEANYGRILPNWRNDV